MVEHVERMNETLIPVRGLSSGSRGKGSDARPVMKWVDGKKL
jgi:hypothetical protein